MTVSTVSAVPDFVTFRRNSPRPEGPKVTLTQRGALNLSPDAVELLGGPQNVLLLWDEKARILGIQPASPSDGDALKLSVTRGLGARTVAAKAFAEWAGIDHATSRRWTAYIDDGVLCVDLSETGEPVSSNRAKRPREQK